ncbi:MAG: PilN domain-containing protein [Methylomonas sp.]|jgi:general secretion pathway protein L
MNLRSTIDFDLKGFFQWWSKELAFLIPQKLRRMLSDRTGDLIFTGGNEGFTVSFQSIGRPNAQEFSVKLTDGADYRKLLSQHAAIEKADVILNLDKTQALAKLIYLPEAALENLQQVAGFELDRYTPFKLDQIYYTVTPLGKTGYGQTQALLVLTPRIILDDLLDQLHAWGVQPSRIEYQPLHKEYPQTDGLYNLLPQRYRPTANPYAKSVHWLLNSLIFILFIGVLTYPVWQEMQAVDFLKGQIKALEKDTRMIDEQQQEINAQLEETKKLVGVKKQTPELVTVMNEMTHLLKNDTWLTNMQYTDRHMQIQGQSPSASSLIGLLEASPYFSKVSFVSPLTQDKATGLERFQISLDVGFEQEKNPSAPESENGESEAPKTTTGNETKP